jgi:hypothetical protein
VLECCGSVVDIDSSCFAQLFNSQCHTGVVERAVDRGFPHVPQHVPQREQERHTPSTWTDTATMELMMSAEPTREKMIMAASAPEESCAPGPDPVALELSPDVSTVCKYRRGVTQSQVC